MTSPEIHLLRGLNIRNLHEVEGKEMTIDD